MREAVQVEAEAVEVAVDVADVVAIACGTRRAIAAQKGEIFMIANVDTIKRVCSGIKRGEKENKDIN